MRLWKKIKSRDDYIQCDSCIIKKNIALLMVKKDGRKGKYNEMTDMNVKA